jgi:hypothetical protein
MMLGDENHAWKASRGQAANLADVVAAASDTRKEGCGILMERDLLVRKLMDALSGEGNSPPSPE